MPPHEQALRYERPPMAHVLWELRQERWLTQREAAERSGVGDKTISAMETGLKIESFKVRQLQALCEAYGITLANFFNRVDEHQRWTEVQ